MQVLNALSTAISSGNAPLPDEEPLVLAALRAMTPDQDPVTVINDTIAAHRAGLVAAMERELATGRYLLTLLQLEALQAEEAAARAAGWDPGFPGAPRILFNGYVWGSDGESGDPRWTADIGLALPPAEVAFGATLYRPFAAGAYHIEGQQGFYPPLRSGVNAVWALGVDIHDPSYFGECAPLLKIERLHTDWSYPKGEPTILEDPGWNGYATRMRLPFLESLRTVPLSGTAAVWIEEQGTWYWRETANTPYGWYTFDIETLQMRPVDTAPDSWDTRHLWADDEPRSQLGVGGWDFAGHQINDPWPAFNPWIEIADGYPEEPGERERPSLFIDRRLTEYMRITCE